MAGNDLLSIDQFARPQATRLQTANLVDTVAYFREEYHANPPFRQRVEDAVDAHPAASSSSSTAASSSRKTVRWSPRRRRRSPDRAPAVVNQIAREAVTLLYPAGSDACPRRRAATRTS